MLYYLIAPVLVLGDKTKVLYWLIPVFILISLNVHRGITFNSALHFFSIYVIGMFCSKYKFYVNKILIKDLMILILFVSFTSFFFAEFITGIGTIESINYWQKLSLLLLILSLLLKFQSKTKSTLITLIANTSFGVFFIHPYVLWMFKLASKYINRQYLNNNFTHIPGNIILHLFSTVLVLILSIFVVILIKRMLGSYTYLLIGNIPDLPLLRINKRDSLAQKS